MKSYKSVDDFVRATKIWHDEIVKLREILLSTGLVETVKWGGPVYTHNCKNIVGIGGFKSYFGLWFFQGALLADDKKVLINAQEGLTKAQRQWRLTSAKEITARTIKAYVKEAIALADAGKKIKADLDKPIVIPPELKTTLTGNKKANAEFKKMTKGKTARIHDLHHGSQTSGDQTCSAGKNCADDYGRH